MDTNENGAGSSIPRDHPATGSAALRRRTAILVTVFAAAGSLSLGAREALMHRISMSLAAGSALLAIALTVILALVVRHVRKVEGRANAADATS